MYQKVPKPTSNSSKNLSHDSHRSQFAPPKFKVQTKQDRPNPAQDSLSDPGIASHCSQFAPPKFMVQSKQDRPNPAQDSVSDLVIAQSDSGSPIQAKLTIGEPGDKYEQEADRVASQVVQQINSPVATQDRATPPKEQLRAKSALQRRFALGGGEASQDLSSAIDSARGGGQPLDAGLQRSMGQAMGANFSGVRVHTDTQSDRLNQSIQAKAFTTRQDVFFRQGAYQPGSRGGQELIAHELTHVVQQNGGVVQRQIQEVISTTPQQLFIQKTDDHAKQLAKIYAPQGNYDTWEDVLGAKGSFNDDQWKRISAAVNLDESGQPQLWDRLGNKVDESPLNEVERKKLGEKIQEINALDRKADPELGLKGIHKSILVYLENTIRDRLGEGGVAQFYKGAHIILEDNGIVYEGVKQLGMPIAATNKDGDILSKTEFVGKTGTNLGGYSGDPEAQRAGKMFTRRPENSETSHYQPLVVDDQTKPLPNKDQGWGHGLYMRATKYEQKNIGYDTDVTTVKPQLGIDLPESVKGHILVGIVPPHLGDNSKNDAVGHTFIQTEGAGFQNFNEASLAHGQGFLANTGWTAQKGTQTGLVGQTLHSEKTTAQDQTKNPQARAEIREQDQYPRDWDWEKLHTEAMEYALEHSK